MSANARIENALASSISGVSPRTCPPKLARAVHYAVFPGGARIRPKLCLAVAHANGDAEPGLADAGAAAIELLHCASLVHDDLPCFDDAAERRGKPSVHIAFGDRIAVLAGDALIVLAFESVAMAATGSPNPQRLPLLLSILGRSVGMPYGISAGQAWECEGSVDVSKDHRSKTGALFVAATCAGAAATGADPAPWRVLGECIGEAYQVADDIHDATADADDSQKPVRRDESLGRPNAVAELGLDGAVTRLRQLVMRGSESIPSCPGKKGLRKLIVQEAEAFMPRRLRSYAA